VLSNFRSKPTPSTYPTYQHTNGIPLSRQTRRTPKSLLCALLPPTGDKPRQRIPPPEHVRSTCCRQRSQAQKSLVQDRVHALERCTLISLRAVCISCRPAQLFPTADDAQAAKTKISGLDTSRSRPRFVSFVLFLSLYLSAALHHL
jgi:hypothetical protein